MLHSESKGYLTLGLTLVTISHSSVSRGTFTVITTLCVLTDLRTYAKLLTLVYVCKGQRWRINRVTKE